MKKNKTVKLASPTRSSRIWNEEEELALLKGFVDYRAEKGLKPNADWGAFHHFFGDSMAAKFSKQQMQRKGRLLKDKFLTRMTKINDGDEPIFSGDEVFRYSNLIWGQNEFEVRENVEEETLEEEAADVQLENVAEETDFGEEEEQVAAVNETNVAEETGFDNGNDDESSNVRDAFETLVLKGLSDYQKKVQLEKLKNLGAGKRKEISDGWKALTNEEVQIEMKMLRFFAKLAEPANDE